MSGQHGALTQMKLIINFAAFRRSFHNNIIPFSIYNNNANPSILLNIESVPYWKKKKKVNTDSDCKQHRVSIMRYCVDSLSVPALDLERNLFG